MCLRKRPVPDVEKDTDIVTVSSASQMILHEPKTKVDMTESHPNTIGQNRIFCRI